MNVLKIVSKYTYKVDGPVYGYEGNVSVNVLDPVVPVLFVKVDEYVHLKELVEDKLNPS
jgi:hypothetical protein